MTSAIVSLNNVVCASSGNADVTEDRQGVMFDNPNEGPAWDKLVEGAGGGALFSVKVSGPDGNWSQLFQCARADSESVQMNQPQQAAARARPKPARPKPARPKR